MIYEWDEGKREANLRDRGVDFAAAARFDWDTAVIEADARQDYGEPRFIARGLIDGRLYVLVYTRRGATTRVISLRKANAREVKRYAKDQT